MDLSTLVTTPLDPPKKPYWQVLQEHQEFRAANPQFADMTVPEFSSHMNEATGSRLYDEGTGTDNFLRRFSGNVDIGLRHVSSPEGDPYGLKRFASGLGFVPLVTSLALRHEGGFNAPKLVSGALGETATELGASPETAQKVAQVGEGLPRTGLDLGFGQVFGLPGIMATSALSTYGETGSKLKAAISAGTIPLFGKASEFGGQSVLKLLGAPTLKALRPDLLSKATALGGEEGLGAFGEKLVPRNVWEGLAKFAGSQTGMFGTMLGSELTQTAIDSNLTGAQKLQQAKEVFSPSSLVASAVSQLPFTALDLTSPHSRPISNVEKTVLPPLKAAFETRLRAEFDKRGMAQPSSERVGEIIDRLLEGKKPTPTTPAEDTISNGSTIGSMVSTITKDTAHDSVKSLFSKSVQQLTDPELQSAIANSESWFTSSNQAVSHDGEKLSYQLRTEEKRRATGELLKSVESPILLDLKRPVRTSEGDVDMGTAVELTKTTAEKIAVARGTPINVDPMRVYSSLRQMEGEGKSTKANLLRNAALHALDTMYSDHENLTKVSPTYTEMEQSRAELDRQEEVRKAVEATVTQKITPTLLSGEPNPEYDPEVHKRIALVSGDPDHRLEAGIHDRIYLQGRTGDPRPLDTSIIDSVRGFIPKVEAENPNQTAYDLNNTNQRIAELDRQIAEAEGQGAPTSDLEQLRGEREVQAGIQQELEAGGELEDKGKTRGKLLEAISTHKAYEAALNYEYPVDLTDPKSVGRFYMRIKSAINQAEQGFLRKRAGEEFVKDSEGVTRTWPTREAAQAAIDTLPEAEGVVYSVPKRAQKDGTFTVLAKRFYRTVSLDPSVGGVEHPRQLGEGMSFEPAEGAHPNYETGGISIGPFHQLEEFQKALPVNKNELLDQMHELNLQRDPAVREAHKLMVAQNVVDYLVNVPQAEIVRIMRQGIGPTATGREPRIQEIGKFKARAIKLIEFLRDGGDLKLTFKQGKNKLLVRPEGNLEAFNNYLGELGWSRTRDMVTPHVQGMTFFEQFHVLSKLIKEEFVQPGKNLDYRERPRGDFGFYPPGFVDDIETKLYVDPQAYPKGLIGSSRKEWGQYSTNPDDPVVLKMTDRNGKEVRFEGGDNPLKTAIVKAAKGQLTMSASKWVAMLKDFAPGADPRLMEVLTNFVSHKFGGDIPVGIAVARDPSSKGWYHFDKDLMQGTGILLSPFSPDLTGRRVAKLDAPEQILTHFVDELAHAHTVFAYRTDASVKSEVDQMFKYVKDYVDSAKSVGALGKFTDSSFYSLSRPEEMLSGMFRDWRLHELLKSIPDPFPGLKTRSLYEKLVDIFRRIFSKFVGEDAAGTMLGRLSELTSRTLEVQLQMKGLGHSGDVYGALEKIPGKKPSTDLIYSPRPKPVEKGTEPTQVYPLDLPQEEPKVITPDLGVHVVPGVRGLGIQEKLQGLGVPPAYRALMEWKGAKLALTKAEGEFADAVKTAGMLPDDPRFLKAKQNLEEAKTREQTAKGLADQSNGPSGETLFSKAIMMVAGKKDTLLRNERVARMVSIFAKGRNVTDAFSGAGQLASFMGEAGGKTTLNVLNPKMHAVFSEVKNNTENFAGRVAKAVEPINAPRDAKPTLKDGTSIKDYLNKLEQTDPTVALLLKQNFSAQGKEVISNTFSPAIGITNAGLKELPQRIRDFAKNVNQISFGDGWNVVANAQAGDRITVDPPYVGQGTHYGKDNISVERQLQNYREKLFPAAKRGAEFIVFDNADPRLVNELKSNGFSVEIAQRPSISTNVKPELVATNMKGEFLESRTDSTPLLDSMSAASLYRTEDPDGIWHKPFSNDHFERTFGPIVGDKLRLERQGGQLGYKISHVDLNNITERDLAQAPVPQVKPYAPTIFETLKSLFRKEGASDQTAEAQSSYLLNIAALLKGTDEATWGKVTNEGNLLGIAWMPEKFAGLSEGMPTLLAKEQVILHESAHLAGFYEDNLQLAPDVRQAVKQVDRVFNELTPDQRLRLVTDMTNLSRQAAGGGLYQASLTQPDEFAAEFMAHVGSSIMNVPKPSALTRDFMRFSPDDMSTLVIRNSFRREQALDKLKDYLQRMRVPANQPQPLLKAVDKMVDAFKSIAREATDIAVDQAEFYRMRAMYPDRYQGLLRQAADKLDAEAPTRPGTPAPKLSGEVLESKITDLYKDVAEHFEYPRDGRFAKKPSVWMRTIAQFAQFAEQFPIARPFYDMLASVQGLERTAIIEMQVAGAGAWSGNRLLDDGRTKQYGVFIKSQKLRDVYSAMQLDIQTELDNRFRGAMKDTEGDIMRIAPQQLQFKTPEFMDALYRKYHVADLKDRATLDTIFEGTTNQIKLTGLKIIQSHEMALKTIGAKAISKALKLPIDQARKASELAYRAIELQNDPTANPQEAMQAATEYQQMVPDSNTQAKVYQLFENGQERVAKLERFLALRMESFASERQFGDYGLWWKDTEGKLVRKFFKSEDQMQGFIKRENVEPVRQIYPTDKNFGVNDELFSTLNEFHDRTMEKLTDLLGETEAKKLSSVLDVATELRDALSARDVLKATAPRKGGSSREYLDMFDTHQNYISSVITAAKTRQMRLEADLLLDQPQFENEPILKNYLQQHLQAVLKPDTKVGTAISNINFLYYIGGNLSTMIQEPFQQLSALAPILTQHGATVKDGFGLIARANKMWLEAKLNRNKYKDPEIDALITRAAKEGVVDQGIFSELDHNEDLSLMNRMRQAGGLSEWGTFDMVKNRLYQLATMARRFYGMVPAYNSEIAVIAAYEHAKAQGLTGEAAYSQARFLKEQAMFGGGKINRPGLFAPDNWLTQGNRSAAQIMWSLQSYSSSMMTIMGNMIKQSVSKGLSPAQSTQVRKAAVQMLGTQFVLAGTLGMPFVQLGIIALQKLFPEENIELMVRNGLNQVEGDDKAMGGFLSSMMTTGLPSAFNYGPDVGSRLAISGTMGVSPYGGVSLDNIIGPTASLVKNVFKGLQAGIQGHPIQTVQSLMPMSFQRIWKTLEEGSTFKSNRGDVLADDLSLPEVLGRAVGFNPERISKLRAADNLARISEDAASHEQSSWIERQAEALQSGEDAKVHQEILDRSKEQKRKPQELAKLISQKVEEKTLPVDTKALGDRRTLADQNRLKGVVGEQSPGPNYKARIQLQRDLARRMGIPLASPSMRSERRASGLDRLMQLYPTLSKSQAEAILARTSTVDQFLE